MEEVSIDLGSKAGNRPNSMAGGVQNIGKKEKEKKDVKEKGKDKDGKEGAGDGKKEKKGMGSIRGIRGFV